MLRSVGRLPKTFGRAAGAAFLIAVRSVLIAQQQAPSGPPDASSDVFRVTTQLVTSDVVVADSKGQPVGDLQREQFDLLVDGRPQAIAFFERVQAGSASEQAQRAAPRGASTSAIPLSSPESAVGRTVLFFVDDLHLAGANLVRAQKLLMDHADREVGPRDLIAIGTTSGQLGFLEQAAGGGTLLRSAAARLKYGLRAILDTESPHILLNQALTITRGLDRSLYDTLVTQTMHELNLDKVPHGHEIAQNRVTGRAQAMVLESTAATRDTLAALDRFITVRTSFPGRKVLFFLSEGFLMDASDPKLTNWMQAIAEIAARSSAVVYTIDMRGLATQPSYDASRAGGYEDLRILDPQITLSSANASAPSEAAEISDSQDPLFRLAAETGGRAIVNTNGLGEAISRVLRETSVYYVLAWTPDDARQDDRFHQIRVTVRGRPDLRVRAPRAFLRGRPPRDPDLVAPPAAADRNPAAAVAAASGVVDAALLDALRAPYPVAALKTSLALDFLDLPDGKTVINASAQLDGNEAVDVAEVVVNDRGEGILSLKEHVDPKSDRAAFVHQFQVKPGLYQVRVAARETNTGRIGSAMEWIVVPTPGNGLFAMSAPVLNREGSVLRFLTYVYNAQHSKKVKPAVELKIEVYRGETRVVATRPLPLKTENATNLSRIPYFGGLNVEGMPSGRYLLRVTATDRAANANISTSMSFEIE